MSTREEKNKEIQEEIEQEEKREKIKKITLIFFKIIFIVISSFIVFYLYTKYISTNSIIIKEKRLVSEKLPESFNSIKIIHFSDLHYGSTIEISDVDKLVKEINTRNVDIVIFTGDLIDKDYNIDKNELEKLIKKLNSIKAPLGKYAISGDEDGDNFLTILKQSGFTLLDNSSDIIYNNSNIPILITGLSSINNNRNIEAAFKNYENNKNLYNILIMHEADSIDEIIPNKNIDLVLAGSSLNGQICITKDMCLIKKKGSEKYFKEYYNVNGTDIFISSGIGNSKPNFRFMVRPSINFFRLAIND